MPLRQRGRAAAIAGALLAVAAVPSIAAAADADVQTSADAADAALSDRLEQLADGPPTRAVHVLVTVKGSTAEVTDLLEGEHVGHVKGIALVAGTLKAGEIRKLGTLDGVLRANAVESRLTGRPLGDPDPGASKATSIATVRKRIADKRKNDKGWQGGGDGLADSNFAAYAKLNLFDARTHRFGSAWKKGFTGEGTTVAVLDGGTDFGHPDLLNTWKVGANGWPEAYDPYGTLQWLLLPEDIQAGLSWYVISEPHTDLVKRGNAYQVTAAMKTGPSRNFAAPAGTVATTFTFPVKWTKSGAVRIANHPDDYLLERDGQRAGILITDPKTAGVYDTVYVDLDGDHDFSDEKPVTRSSPASYRDIDHDGFTDVSGGLLYYISDGVGGSPVPGGPEEIFGLNVTAPSGAILAWTGDYDPAIEGHGTLTASNVAGQGVVNGLLPRFRDLPGNGRPPAAVVGGAPDTKLVPFGDIYFAFEISTQIGYVLGFNAGVDVLSNSYGSSDADNDGLDAASQEADFWNNAFGNQSLSLFSTGNGAPGFGTTSPPSPATGMSVGASTQFSGTGWDSIKDYSQVVDNDVIEWSNRGPGANGTSGVDIVADGAYAPGDATLNSVGDGSIAWASWGGTSRSTPVAAGAAALVYQAWREGRGTSPNAFDVRSTLMSSARDLDYQSFIQGAGSLDAGRAVDLAKGAPGRVTPESWRPGGYAGQQWAAFPHVLAPGGSSEQQFTVEGGGKIKVSDRYLVRTDRVEQTFTSAPTSKESEYSFNAPDYLIDVSRLVKKHPNAELMVVRMNFDHSQLDPNGDYTADQAWRMLTYSWTDQDGDGRLWRDKDGDGVVDHVQLPTSSNIDGNPDINFGASEIDKGEYVRFMYHRPGSNALVNFVRDPKARMADGIFIGLQHQLRAASLPQTAFTLEIDFYDTVDWPWLRTAVTGPGTFAARVDVPADAPYGAYDGAIEVTHADGSTSIVPVALSVAASAQQAADGTLQGTTSFGGAATAAAQSNLLYNNGSVFGAHDWTWRAESGDWRFFFLDVPKAPPPGTLFLADTTWDDAAPATDLDTVILGPSENTFVLAPDGPVGAPYILDTVGASENTNTTAGVWQFNTATGGPEEIVTAPAQQGLHAFLEHQVLWQGGKFDVPFDLTVGSVAVNPSTVTQTATADSGAFDVSVTSSIDLPDGIAAGGFGLSQFQAVPVTVVQDDPDDPNTASNKVPFTIAHASRASISVSTSGDNDLYILRDANGDGTFSFPAELVASSATGSGDEAVTMTLPDDGNYQAWVHGFGIASPEATQVHLDIVQGTDVTVTAPTGPVSAGTPVTVHGTWAKALTPGQVYHGEVLMGPASAPTAIRVPITITRQ